MLSIYHFFVASFAGPPTLEYRDVFVLCDEPLDRNVSRKAIGLIQGLRSQPFRIQVHVLKKDATWAEIRDVVIAKHNMVTVAHWETIQGLARKVVVVMRCTATNDHERLYTMSRCSAQLVIIDWFVTSVLLIQRQPYTFNVDWKLCLSVISLINLIPL